MEPPPEDQKSGGTSSGGEGSSNSITNNDNNEATTTAKINLQAEQQPLEEFPDGWTKRKIPITTGVTEYTYHYSPLEQHIFNSSEYI